MLSLAILPLADAWSADELGWLPNFTTVAVLDSFRNRSAAFEQDKNKITRCIEDLPKSWCQGFSGTLDLFDGPDGSMGMNYSVMEVEKFGGFNQICGRNCGTFPLPRLQQPVRYPCNGASRLKLAVRVLEPASDFQSSSHSMSLRILLYDTSDCTHRCDEGRSVEQWYHADADILYSNHSGWKELTIDLIGSTMGSSNDQIFGSSFALPMWAGIVGNGKLDPGAISNWALTFVMSPISDGFNASGAILVSNMTCEGSPDEYLQKLSEESTADAQPPTGLWGQLSGGSGSPGSDRNDAEPLACDASAMPLDSSATVADSSQLRAVGISRDLAPPAYLNLSGATELTTRFMVTHAESGANASLRLTLHYIDDKKPSHSTYIESAPVNGSTEGVLQYLIARPPPDVIEHLSGINIHLIGRWQSLAVRVAGPFVTEAIQPHVTPPTFDAHCTAAPLVELEPEAAFVTDRLHFDPTLNEGEFAERDSDPWHAPSNG